MIIFKHLCFANVFPKNFYTLKHQLFTNLELRNSFPIQQTMLKRFNNLYLFLKFHRIKFVY